MIDRLLNWLDASTCNFLAAKTITEQLNASGFTRLEMQDVWQLEANTAYYLTRNSTAVFAFITGTEAPAEAGFRIISAHSDSPCFKIKPNAERYGDGGVVTLNVEKYGGGILYTWFDRPLSISGRVMLRTEDPMQPKEVIVDLKRSIAFIPHLAIHFNREVNEGNKLSVQKDMQPVIGYFSPKEIEEQKKRGGAVKMLVARELNIEPEEITDYELALYPVEKAALVGYNNEFFQSGRIDDLSMAFAGLEALLAEAKRPMASTRILAIFDNEETGSGTKQGAHSPILANIMLRIAGNNENLIRSLARSFMISADDAHAWHPNYNEKYDPTNHPVMGGGPTVKINANCKYMTDARAAAIFTGLCRCAGVKYQYFVNHSDVAGGSTLGNILTGQLDIDGVDMGCSIWAMHSARETGAVTDQKATVKVFSYFFGVQQTETSR